MSHVFVCSFVENVIADYTDAEIDAIEEDPVMIVEDSEDNVLTIIFFIN
jgi:hypothetical protein